MSDDSLGCGKRFKNIFNSGSRKQKEFLGDCDFICGVADGNGKETLCLGCDFLLKESWRREDLKNNVKGGSE